MKICKNEHTHTHTYPCEPHHLSDSWQSWQTFILHNTTSIPTEKVLEGPFNMLGERRKHTLNFSGPFVCLSRLRKHWNRWLLLSTSWTKGRGANEGGSLSDSCTWLQVQRRWPSSDNSLHVFCVILRQRGECLRVGVDLVSFQHWCQVGPGTAVRRIRHPTEMLAPLLTIPQRRDYRTSGCPRCPLLGPEGELWRHP